MPLLEELECRKKLLIDNVVKLERHRYSPEQNKLHLKNDVTYPVPGITDIDSAIHKVFISVQWIKLKENLITNEEISK
jgi:hypothetical protein